MVREVKLSRVQTVLGELSYPITRTEAAEELDDVVLLLADGERNLGELVSEMGEKRFDSDEEFRDELNGVLPREAVGEPFQSEGDG